MSEKYTKTEEVFKQIFGLTTMEQQLTLCFFATGLEDQLNAANKRIEELEGAILQHKTSMQGCSDSEDEFLWGVLDGNEG